MLKVRRAMREGKRRIMVCAPTGSGKTEMAMKPLIGAAAKGNKATFACDRIPLVGQTSRRLHKYGIIHGIAQGENTMGRLLPIQVASIQTIERRGYWDDEVEIFVWDEAHTKHRKLQQAASQSGAYIIGLSATPITEGLGEFWECVVNVATTKQLLTEINPDTGRTYLCPLTMYAAQEIDMQGALVDNTGEWRTKEVEKRGKNIIGDIVPEWTRRTYQHFDGPVQTLVFSRSVAQGEEICRAFLDAGVEARQSTYMDKQGETDQTVQDFADRKFQILISVDKFVKGYDNPEVRCIIDCNPRRTSLAALLQGMGRGMRDAPGKMECLYIDHVGNISGWYYDIMEFWENGVTALDDKYIDRVRVEGRKRKEAICPQCSYVVGHFSRTGGICPSCGWQAPQSLLRSVPGKTQKVTGPMGERQEKPQKGWDKPQDWTWRQLCTLALRYKKGDMVAAKKSAAGMFKGIFGDWPPWSWGLSPAGEPVDIQVEKRVRSNNIRRAKGKGKSGP